MILYIEKRHASLPYRLLSAFIAFTFAFSIIIPPQACAQVPATPLLNLPVPGTMVPLSPGFTPPIVRGITIHPENPLRFDFIVDPGDDNVEGDALRQESSKLIKYFLASLTIPEEEMWVNLSPYEKDRIIEKSFGDTEMGRDLLAQDYLLKQLTASLMYPEDELGQKFWDRVYKKAYEEYGTTEIPVNTFNKVWIVPEKAVVYEHDSSAFVLDTHLKVMLEEDYVALQHAHDVGAQNFEPLRSEPLRSEPPQENNSQSEIIREILIPEIEKEVNEGETFANLRQIYNSMILATWYKVRLKDSLLGQVYADQGKTKGIDIEDKQANQKIYNQYVEAFKKGVYDYIREDYDPNTQKTIPRKYFSGGFSASPVFGQDFSSKIRGDLVIGATDLVKAPANLQKNARELQDLINEEAYRVALMLNEISPGANLTLLKEYMPNLGAAQEEKEEQQEEVPQPLETQEELAFAASPLTLESYTHEYLKNIKIDRSIHGKNFVFKMMAVMKVFENQGLPLESMNLAAKEFVRLIEALATEFKGGFFGPKRMREEAREISLKLEIKDHDRRIAIFNTVESLAKQEFEGGGFDLFAKWFYAIVEEYTSYASVEESASPAKKRDPSAGTRATSDGTSASPVTAVWKKIEETIVERTGRFWDEELLALIYEHLLAWQKVKSASREELVKQLVEIIEAWEDINVVLKKASFEEEFIEDRKRVEMLVSKLSGYELELRGISATSTVGSEKGSTSDQPVRNSTQDESASPVTFNPREYKEDYIKWIEKALSFVQDPDSETGKTLRDLLDKVKEGEIADGDDLQRFNIKKTFEYLQIAMWRVGSFPHNESLVQSNFRVLQEIGKKYTSNSWMLLIDKNGEIKKGFTGMEWKLHTGKLPDYAVAYWIIDDNSKKFRVNHSQNSLVPPEILSNLNRAMDRYNTLSASPAKKRDPSAGTRATSDGKSASPVTAKEALEESHKADVTDEFVKPWILKDAEGKPVGRIKENDSVIFFNFRADRARELSKAFVDPNFTGFKTRKDLNLTYVTMTQYEEGLVPDDNVAFHPVTYTNTLGEIISKAGLRQFRIAETEKYGHVTYFFNGGREEKFDGEERQMVPSPKDVPTYDLKPEMSAPEVTNILERRIKEKGDEFIVVNYANLDMVGHTGVEEAAQKAVNVIDESVKRVTDAAQAAGYNIIITADHGNAEQMWNYETDGPHTAHTKNLVPFIFIPSSKTETIGSLREDGRLSDIAPTVVESLGLPKPSERGGESLLKNFRFSRDIQQKTLLILLDGWGFNPNRKDPHDAIRTAKPEFLNGLLDKYPNTLIKTNGLDVGLHGTTMGNSEVGHKNIGAGRITKEDVVRINDSIDDRSFFENPALLKAVMNAKEEGRALHLLGLVSGEFVHSAMGHLFALLELAKTEGVEVYIHAFLDGRDTPPKSGIEWLKQLEEKINEIGWGQVVDITGRYYAMDRDKRWDRVEIAYNALVHGQSASPVKKIKEKTADILEKRAGQFYFTAHNTLISNQEAFLTKGFPEKMMDRDVFLTVIGGIIEAWENALEQQRSTSTDQSKVSLKEKQKIGELIDELAGVELELRKGQPVPRQPSSASPVFYNIEKVFADAIRALKENKKDRFIKGYQKIFDEVLRVAKSAGKTEATYQEIFQWIKTAQGVAGYPGYTFMTLKEVLRKELLKSASPAKIVSDKTKGNTRTILFSNKEEKIISKLNPKRKMIDHEVTVSLGEDTGTVKVSESGENLDYEWKHLIEILEEEYREKQTLGRWLYNFINKFKAVVASGQTSISIENVHPEASRIVLKVLRGAYGRLSKQSRYGSEVSEEIRTAAAEVIKRWDNKLIPVIWQVNPLEDEPDYRVFPIWKKGEGLDDKIEDYLELTGQIASENDFVVYKSNNIVGIDIGSSIKRASTQSASPVVKERGETVIGEFLQNRVIYEGEEDHLNKFIFDVVTPQATIRRILANRWRGYDFPSDGPVVDGVAAILAAGKAAVLYDLDFESANNIRNWLLSRSLHDYDSDLNPEPEKPANISGDILDKAGKNYDEYRSPVKITDEIDFGGHLLRELRKDKDFLKKTGNRRITTFFEYTKGRGEKLDALKVGKSYINTEVEKGNSIVVTIVSGEKDAELIIYSEYAEEWKMTWEEKKGEALEGYEDFENLNVKFQTTSSPGKKDKEPIKPLEEERFIRETTLELLNGAHTKAVHAKDKEAQGSIWYQIGQIQREDDFYFSISGEELLNRLWLPSAKKFLREKYEEQFVTSSPAKKGEGDKGEPITADSLKKTFKDNLIKKEESFGVEFTEKQRAYFVERFGEWVDLMMAWVEKKREGTRFNFDRSMKALKMLLDDASIKEIEEELALSSSGYIRVRVIHPLRQLWNGNKKRFFFFHQSQKSAGDWNFYARQLDLLPLELRKYLLASVSESKSTGQASELKIKKALQDMKNMATSSPAKKGGIDLNPELLDLQIKRDQNGVPLPLPQQPIGEMKIEGFLPVIINVAPVYNLPLLLGLSDVDANDVGVQNFEPLQDTGAADTDSQPMPMDLGFADKYREKYIRQYQNEDIDI